MLLSKPKQLTQRRRANAHQRLIARGHRLKELESMHRDS